MKSLLLSAYRQLEITETPQPSPSAGEVVVRVAACGICGSDVHGYDGSTGRRIPPIVMGHEAAGTIAALGSDVHGYAIGDRVTFDSTIYCGRCSFCLQGLVNLCDNRQVLGVSTEEYRRAGAFAEYVLVPERILYRLPDNLTFTDAAMLEAVAVALHAASLTRPQSQPQTTAMVIGAGMIGVLALQALHAEGFSTVFVADVDPSRLKLAQELGADRIFDLSGDDLAAEVFSQTNGAGVDAVIEAVGIETTVLAAISSVRKGGTVTLVGNITPMVTLPLQQVVTRQIRLQGSAASAGEYPRAIELVTSGAIRVKPLISAIAPLEDGPQWFERLYAHEPNLMKVVLTPDQP